MLDLVRTSYVMFARLGKFRPFYFSLEQVSSGYERLCEVRSGETRIDNVMAVSVSLCQVRLGDISLGYVKSC